MTTTPSDELPLPFRRSPLGIVEERELDLLLLLEFHASDAFRRSIVQKVTRANEARFVGAWRGVATHLGETDILMVCDVEDQGRVAIMIEDKIDAPFQQTQAERYHARGKLGIEDKLWDRYYACLCCPVEYAPSEASNAWHSLLTLEDILAHVRERADADARSVFLASALEQAIKKFKSGSFVVDPTASAFWQEYQRFCLEHHGDLSMSRLQPVHSRNEPWPRFAAGMLPRDVRLEHRAGLGSVDMAFEHRKADEVRPKLVALLRPGLQVVRTSQSCVLRWAVRPVKFSEPFGSQKAEILQAFDAVRALLGLWPEIRTSLGYSTTATP